MQTFQDFKKETFKKRKGVKREYDLLQPEFEAISKIIELRIKKDLSQKELAKRIFTKQPSVSRLERGLTNPSIYFLSKIAHALGKRLEINFK